MLCKMLLELEIFWIVAVISHYEVYSCYLDIESVSMALDDRLLCVYVLFNLGFYLFILCG